MKRVCFLVFLSLGPTFTNAQPLSGEASMTTDIRSPLVASYLRDLEELGYCVIPQVLSTAEAEALYQRVWHEFIEKAWPNCRMDDRSNWKEAFPMHNKMGIFSGPAGQTQVMWDLRQDPRIVNVFVRVWNTNDLIVSMDGLSFMCPPEIRDGYFEPWPHVDPMDTRKLRPLEGGVSVPFKISVRIYHIPLHLVCLFPSKDLRSDRPKVTLVRDETVRPKEHGSELTVKLSKANSGEEPTEVIIPILV